VGACCNTCVKGGKTGGAYFADSSSELNLVDSFGLVNFAEATITSTVLFTNPDVRWSTASSGQQGRFVVADWGFPPGQCRATSCEPAAACAEIPMAESSDDHYAEAFEANTPVRPQPQGVTKASLVEVAFLA